MIGESIRQIWVNDRVRVSGEIRGGCNLFLLFANLIFFPDMTDFSRLEYSGVHHQRSRHDSYPQLLNMYGHYISATYFSAVLPTHHVTQHTMTTYPLFGQARDVHSAGKESQRSVSHSPYDYSLMTENQLHTTDCSTSKRRDQVSINTVSPMTQLCLPTIKTSANVAENVMMEEADLGYGSWPENLTGLDEFNLSSGSDNVFDDVQSNLSDIIDDVINDVGSSCDFSTGETATTETTPGAASYLQSCSVLSAVTQHNSNHVMKNSSPIQTHKDATTEQFLKRVEERKQACKQFHRCPLCNKQYVNKINLQVHLRMHSDLRPHRCTYCEKSFTQKSTLRTHMRTHTGEKPFVCSHCARAFSDYSAYRKHQRVHSGEKPYICGICSKSFLNPGT